MAAKAKAKRAAGKGSNGDGRLKVEYVPIADLVPWDKNPRKNDEVVDSIVRSIERFGYTNPILARRADRRIIAGHTRVKALQKVGETSAPVIFLDIDGTDADLYALFDNKATENTPWDIPKLSELFAELSDIGADVVLTGFSLDEIGDITESPNEADAGASANIPDEQYQILIDCKDEICQQELYEHLVGEGHKCRLLTL